MAHIGMAYIVVAYIVTAYIFTAYIVMAGEQIGDSEMERGAACMLHTRRIHSKGTEHSPTPSPSATGFFYYSFFFTESGTTPQCVHP